MITDIGNGWLVANTLVVGSNYYDSTPPVISGRAALVADPLPATPIGEAACGDNSPAKVVAYTGSGQSTPINSSFANPLQARVVDMLGEAVMDQPVSFNAPSSGASASFSSAASGTTDYNGVFATTTAANGIAGTYVVTAADTAPSAGGVVPRAEFALTNDKGVATITLDAGTLSATYDGSQHAVTATTDPVNLHYDVIYGGSTTAPTNAGSYAVVATIDDSNYTGTASGTLVISKATGNVAWGSLSFTHDGSARAVTAQIAEEPASSCTVTPATVGPDVGSYVVTATCDSTNYTASGNNIATITAEPTTDLAVSITDDRDYAQYGHVLSYVIVVSNVGNQDVTGATISDALPDILLPQQPVSWHCYAGASASCASTSGSGDLSVGVDIPAQGSITIVLDTVVNDAPTFPPRRSSTR